MSQRTFKTPDLRRSDENPLGTKKSSTQEKKDAFNARKLQQVQAKLDKSKKTAAAPVAAAKPSKEEKAKDQLLAPEAVWYEILSELPALEGDEYSMREVKDPKMVLQKREEAEKFYNERVAAFEKKHEKKAHSEEAWMKTVMKSGTVTDKLAAITLLIQAAPLFRIKHVDTLLGMATKKNRREAVMAIDTLKDLFTTNLLPSDRKLIPFHKRPLGNKGVQDVHLMIWLFEDYVKDRYTEFLRALEASSHDSVLFTKKKVQNIAYDLILEKPEQEMVLLQLLVNKMGDTENKVASNSVYLMTLMLEKHPAMKLAVVKEVESFLHRPHVSLRAQYYAVIFLNQLILTKDNVDLSKKLLTIYFSMFKKLVANQRNLESKMLSALLTGVNRAFPFAPQDSESFEEQMDMLFKIVHITTFNKSVQALLLIFQVMFAQKNVTDRFYRAVYAKLLSPDIFGSTRVGLFLNVLYKAMRHDQDTARVKAFVKRILQICFYQKPQFVCGSLFLLSELFRGRTELRATMFDEVEVQPEMLKQLAEKAMGEIDATLQLPSPVGESSAAQPSTKNGKPKPEILIYYPGKKQLEEQQRAGKPAAPFSKVNTGADANSNEEEDGEASYPLEDSAAAIQKALAQFDLRKTPLSRYDELKRDPKFAGAGSAPCWELTLLTHHFHPSVSLWAGKLLAGDPISYPGDPLKDMALQSFLDRFMYKNPKEINRKKDSSQTQAARRMGRHYVPDRTMPVNSSAFRAKNIDDVPADELFYYKFFKQRDQQHPELATGRGRGDEDDFSGEDADFGGAVDDEELGSAEEAEIEDTLLDELEKKEGTKIKDRQKPDKEEYDYDDMEASDVEEESDLEAGSGSEMGDDEFAKMIMDEEDDDDGAMDVDDDDDGEGLLGSVDSGELDDDEDDDDELGGDEEEEEDEKPKKKKNRFGKGSFASLDEFAHLLETSGNLGEDDKQLKWEQGGMRKNKGFKRKKPDAGKSSSKKKRAPNSKKRKR